MGRWVRWFGESEAVEAPPPLEPEAAVRTITVPEEKAREVASAPAGTVSAPVPTGAMSVVRLPAEMLTAVLVKDGALSQADEHIALQEHRATGRPIEEILVDSRMMGEDELLAVLSRKCKVPHLSLARYQVRPEVLDAVPSEFARANRMIPLEKLGKILNVATSNPLNHPAFMRLEEETGFRVKPMLAGPRDLAECLDRYYPPPPEESAPGLEEEKKPFSTKEIFRDSWLALVGDKDIEEFALGEGAATEAGAPQGGPAGEAAIPLSEEDAIAFTRVPSGGLFRDWMESVGAADKDVEDVQDERDEPCASLSASPVTEGEFALVAALEEGRPLEEPSPPEAEEEKRAPWWKDFRLTGRKVEAAANSSKRAPRRPARKKGKKKKAKPAAAGKKKAKKKPKKKAPKKAGRKGDKKRSR